VHARHLRPGHERHVGGGVKTPRERVQSQLRSLRVIHVSYRVNNSPK